MTLFKQVSSWPGLHMRARTWKTGRGPSDDLELRWENLLAHNLATLHLTEDDDVH